MSKRNAVTKMKLRDVVIDFGLYPRGSVDDYHCGALAVAIEAGCGLPPIIVDRKSKRVVDGIHRVTVFRRRFAEDDEIDVELRDYVSDGELFLDAVRLNASHGRILTVFDKAKCVLKAKDLKIEPEQIAEAMHLTMDAVGKLTQERMGRLRRGGPIALKRTIRHMADKTLTRGQVEANEKLSGMEQAFYVNQLITLIQNDLLDMANEDLMAKIATLRELIDGLLLEA